ncbi:MAG: ATP-binding response regulator, partial [Deferrisomatales bacterium]
MAASPTRVERPPAEPPGSVLIVEDELEVADVLEFNLRAAGFATRTATDGLTACRMIGARPPDLVLLDLLLSDLTGWEICRMIRGHADPAVAGLPVIMLTALASAEDRARGLELGADDYLPKPFTVREVVLRARNLVCKAREAARRVHCLQESQESHRDPQSRLFHELRNKLVVIVGFANRLVERAPEDGRSGRYAEVIREASAYLGTLADQVLVLSRVEDGGLGLAPEDVDLAEVAQAAADLHREPAADKGIQLRLETGGPTVARGHALALRVCLSNLV